MGGFRKWVSQNVLFRHVFEKMFVGGDREEAVMGQSKWTEKNGFAPFCTVLLPKLKDVSELV